MAKNYKQIVEDARKHSRMAQESSARHSHDLSDMKQVADDAAENAKTSRASLRKRDAFNKAADQRSEGRTRQATPKTETRYEDAEDSKAI